LPLNCLGINHCNSENHEFDEGGLIIEIIDEYSEEEEDDKELKKNREGIQPNFCTISIHEREWKIGAPNCVI
jgi:hypothetical protein